MLDGALIQQHNPEKVFTGEGKSRIGPGQYEINRDFMNKTKGTNWHSSAVGREFSTRYNKLVEKSNLGPGAYNIERNIGKKYKQPRQAISACIGTRGNKSTMEYCDERADQENDSYSDESPEDVLKL